MALFEYKFLVFTYIFHAPYFTHKNMDVDGIRKIRPDVTLRLMPVFDACQFLQLNMVAVLPNDLSLAIFLMRRQQQIRLLH